MLHQLVNHNDDLRRLLEKGYAVAIDSGYLIIRDIPYLDDGKQLQWGAFVVKLEFVDRLTVKQDDHQIWFSGLVPHGLDGKPIPNLAGGPTTLALGEASKDIVVQRRFSNKPKATGKFADFFEKIESYLTIIAGPAMEQYSANPYTFRTVEKTSDSVFKFHDTLTSRAEITDLSWAFVVRDRNRSGRRQRNSSASASTLAQNWLAWGLWSALAGRPRSGTRSDHREFGLPTL